MQRDFDPTVYMLASHRNGTLYIGVTSNLLQRLCQHRSDLIEGFTKDYGVHRLVWFESGGSMEEAIQREKRIKKWNRQWKIHLIEQANPDWRDLAVDLGFEPLVESARRLSAMKTWIVREMDCLWRTAFPAFSGMTKL